MMKKITLIVWFCMNALVAASQTNTFPTSGSVGIGTTSPSAKFQVQKDGPAPAIVIGGSNSGSPRLQTYSLADDPHAWMGLGTDMAGNPYENSIYFPTAPNGYIGRLSMGNYDGTTYQSRFMMLDNGNIGLGYNDPQASLDIKKIYNTASTKALRMFYDGSWGYVHYANDFRFIDISSTEGGTLLQVNGYGIGVGTNPPLMDSPDKLYVMGNVGIGTTTPKEKLSVNGKIRAKEIKVETANWPDYVFEEGYQPKTLKQIDEFVKLNKHLPEVPSAKEVAQNGIELGEMNKILLKKIEELTLHLIAKDKKVEQQDLAIKDLSRQMQELQNLIKSGKNEN